MASLDSYARARIDQEKTDSLASFRNNSVPNTYGFYDGDSDLEELLRLNESYLLSAILFEGVDSVF